MPRCRHEKPGRIARSCGSRDNTRPRAWALAHRQRGSGSARPPAEDDAGVAIRVSGPV